jgi:integrase
MSETKKAHYGVGRVFPHPKSRYWFAAFYISGRERRLSTGVEYSKDEVERCAISGDEPTVGRRKAERQLETLKREAKAVAVAGPEPVTYQQIRAVYIADFEREGFRSGDTMKSRLVSLDRCFGAMTVGRLEEEPAEGEITSAAVTAYIDLRLKEKRAKATINNELTILGKMLSLGTEGAPPLIPPGARLPKIKLFSFKQLGNARQGFVRPADFAKIVAALPKHLKPFCAFLYGSAWRVGEARGLLWSDVNIDDGMIEIDGSRTKNGEPRTLPFAAIPYCREAIETARERYKVEDDFVFCDDEPYLHRPIGDFRRSWRTACKKAGIVTLKGRALLVHDLRRSAISNLIDAGVAQSDAQTFSGHLTASTFSRYNIRDKTRQRAAAAKLGAFLSGKQTAAPETPAIRGALETDGKQTDKPIVESENIPASNEI